MTGAGTPPNSTHISGVVVVYQYSIRNIMYTGVIEAVFVFGEKGCDIKKGGG